MGSNCIHGTSVSRGFSHDLISMRRVRARSALGKTSVRTPFLSSAAMRSRSTSSLRDERTSIISQPVFLVKQSRALRRRGIDLCVKAQNVVLQLDLEALFGRAG